jgi:D-lactate dehydrogenase
MRVAVFSTKEYDRQYLREAVANGASGPHGNRHDQHGRHDLTFLDVRLGHETAPLAAGYEAVCLFVNDVVDAQVAETLSRGGTRLVALRCAGFNNVALDATSAQGITVVRVPAYSPHAVAEHTVALMLSLNRKIHRAYNRVREGNFAIDGLLGFDFAGRTVGVVGTGKIGAVVARIMRGFDCRVIATDLFPNPSCVAAGVEYVPFERLLSESDVITLHCPLTQDSRHLLGREAFARMKPGVMVINTSRGALLDAAAAIEALKSGHLGSLGLDVYEEESDIFFEDLSNRVLHDDVLARLLTFPNVLITSHQGFFTHEALSAIASITVRSLTAFELGEELGDVVCRPAS